MSTVQLLHEFRAMGCEDEIKRGAAARVYIDLVDVARATEIKSNYDGELNEIYFSGKESKGGVEVLNIYLPVSSHNGVDFSKMEHIQNKLSADTKSIVLCICDASSTVLYYRLTHGFQEKRGEKHGTTS